MSHFSVLVAAENTDDLFEKLLPYYEYGTSNEYDNLIIAKGYAVWEDIDGELRKEYKTKTVERVKLPNGELIEPWDDRFRVSGTYGYGGDTHRVPEELERIQVPVKKIYKGFDKYVTEYHGYEKHSETGKYGYWHNPNDRGDWYSVGGRWNNLLILRNGNSVNIGLASDINWAAMRAKRAANAEAAWDAWETVVRWASTPEELLAAEKSEDKEAAKQIREKIKAAASDDSHKDDSSYANYVFFDPVGDTREEHISRSSNGGLTMAFINCAGDWHARATMGWWGSTSNGNSAYDDSEFQQFIDTLPGNQRIYVVDCHI